MRVFITGATGFIGRELVKTLLLDGHEVTAMTRNATRDPAEKSFGRSNLENAAQSHRCKADERQGEGAYEKKVRDRTETEDNAANGVFGRASGAKGKFDDQVKIIEGDSAVSGAWLDEIDGHQAVINLCGESIFKGKWTTKRKAAIRDSRIIPTRLIVEAVARAENKPEVFLSGSAIGYYGSRGDELLTEDSSRGPKDDFLASLSFEWESAAAGAGDFGVRVVNLRTGIVLGPYGGALPEMSRPFRFFVGGPFGAGRQYISWIHIKDYVAITERAMVEKDIAGPVNLTAPKPVTNREFMDTLGKVLDRPSWLPVPAFALKAMFGESAFMLLEGQRVLPKKAQDAGCKWKFPNLEAALEDIHRSSCTGH